MTPKDGNETLSREAQLEILDPSIPHAFVTPTKKIHDGPDVNFFLTSLAYRDIVTFTLQLNRSLIPRKLEGRTQTFELGSENISLSDPVKKLQSMIGELTSIIDETPPDTGPRRFGNVSFRKWYNHVEDRAEGILAKYVPLDVLAFRSSTEQDGALLELKAYFLGSFGSPQRLDYGTGHELSFLAFIAGIWKLGGFAKEDPGVEERGIVLGVFEPYLHLIRQLIKTYTLEPAGSHGVWGLDDNSFLPYIFGSAQFAPAIAEDEATPIEGSLPDSPDASAVTKAAIVEDERKRNMYFSAIGNIYDVKRGPFWEHSPMLFDISGIRAGWAKINKGMIKMYNAEVLSKFPVVQHFPLGSLFKWEKDPEAKQPSTSTHTTSQPLRNPLNQSQTSASRAPATAAPWADTASKAPVGIVDGVTRAPWASQTRTLPPPPGGFNAMGRAPIPSPNIRPGQGQLPTRAVHGRLPVQPPVKEEI
ncbi:putative serine threonine-protein phosphatase 2a activator 1 [Phaeomoniella chlamydospora]|uniref:Serine/threonine-protein phosphatase 2A activator n=1 Tax=Phaeomoniella chlamydospora TaxID=158046 RepID=A0A0G2FV37_PHACM|nr:putative serine threonine-protein phosphatase 2a activator 1 [Phaeomoniella chlamydospora]